MAALTSSAVADLQPEVAPRWQQLRDYRRARPAAGVRAATKVTTAPRVATSERIVGLDLTRGLFLILMAASHAFTLSGLPGTSPLATWGLPRGWATTGLIMLCGFTVATLARHTGYDGARRRVLRRARQVLLVMLASNLIFVPAKLLLTHDHVERLTSAQWWTRFLLPGAEWSISGILLPIGLFLLLCPTLLRWQARCRSLGQALALTALVMTVVMATWTVRFAARASLAHHHWLDVLLGSGVGGFPVVPLIASGGLGFMIGVLWRPLGRRVTLWTLSAIAAFFVAGALLKMSVPAVVKPALTRAFVDSSHLLIVMVLALALLQWRPSLRVTRLVALLGASSLLTFLAHRVLEQTARLVITPLEPPAALAYWICLAAGVGGSMVLIALRRRYSVYDRVLRAAYL